MVNPKLEAALHEASVYGIGATSDTNQRIILEAAKHASALQLALKPFISAADNYADCSDDRHLDDDATITVGDLREARAAAGNAGRENNG